ncbi:hypothetical protein DICSQDRAFT_152266 [Dichomitus squalens LYAD-421 SS1]|uniref:uncharacterized protein n=1 Tax=Dichomitus squalens (strain LYAD-421) TaxID=732165 RepID=UPI0004413F56|nr:uncharacterized protein DICSQDRAFT_152266 [Dichomitus squalens LYAD-421 SS1]EJF66301.1 hypothetical protein DICSQDRAFT_152266 [Dichomitus squalens LYAD-421 SS1]
MSTPSYDLDVYKIPRNLVDVEALAQQASRYLKIAAEDAEFLSYHATRRDEIVAELYRQPGIKPNTSPDQFVPQGADPDVHLIPADAVIEELTPPKTLEDRVKRLHFAAAAMSVFSRFKITYGLLDHPDLEMQYQRRRTQIMSEYYKTEFALLFPESMKRVAAKRMPVTPPTRGHLPSPPPSRPSTISRRVSREDVDRFLNNPNTLVGKRFVHSTQGEGQDQSDSDYGTWHVTSYTVRVADGGVEHEYQVVLEALGGGALPMDGDEVRYLLQDSTFAV